MIRLHILYHASKGPIFGFWIIEELARHGYKLSPGTLYPILHGMERKGYLRSTEERQGRQARRLYRATPAGRRYTDSEAGSFGNSGRSEHASNRSSDISVSENPSPME